MRNDMDKIINEPGKTPRRWSEQDKGTFKNIPVEDLPLTEAMNARHRSNYKSARVNTNPLRRWLEKQIGRSWNDVFHEVCETLGDKPGKKNYAHSDMVRLLDWLVETNVTMKDGEPYKIGVVGFAPINSYYCDALYVHPDTGILCLVKHKHQPKRVKPVTFRELKKLDKAPNGLVPSVLHNHIKNWFEAIEKVDGIWYFVKGYIYYYRTLNAYYRRFDTSEIKHIVYKRQLNKKDLKKYGVHNDLAGVS